MFFLKGIFESVFLLPVKKVIISQDGFIKKFEKFTLLKLEAVYADII